jgi:hypothetical protein
VTKIDRHQDYFAHAKRKRSAIWDVLAATAYGPFNCLKWAVCGSVAGTVGFLLFKALSTPNPDQGGEMATVLVCAAAGAVLLSLIALIADYIIGRPLYSEDEIQREIFAGGSLPPPRRRPDVPGISLGQRVR